MSRGEVIALPRPTRTPADAALNLPPCGNRWTPDTCRGYGRHTAGQHRCWTWTGWPHICRCLRCGEGAT